MCENVQDIYILFINDSIGKVNFRQYFKAVGKGILQESNINFH